MLRVGIVGLGWWGKQIVRCLKGSRRFRVVCGTDLAGEALAGFATENGFALVDDFAALLERADIDAVVIATPHSRHEPQVLQAIAAGKQVFCEKPLAMTEAGARRIIEACAARGLVLGIGHERRREPALAELRRMVAAGEIGALLAFDANVSHDVIQKTAADNWRRGHADAPAGLFTGVGIHLTDLFVLLAGPVARVEAWTASRVFTPPAEDVMTARIEFASGVHALLTCLSATPYYGRFTVQGSRGWIEVTEGGNVDRGLPSRLVHCDASGARTERLYEPVNTVLGNFEAWADAVEGRAPYDITPAQIIENTRIFEGIVRSAAAGGVPITFP